MRKLILYSLIVLSNFTYGQNFPGSSVELLIGKDLKVREKEETLQKYGYREFYTDESLKMKFDASLSDANSKYESLVGKAFKLISFDQYIDKSGIKKFKLKIENPETGVLYYDYDPRFENEFEFEVVGGIDYPTGFFDKEIKESRDKFKNEITYTSPVGYDKINFMKVKDLKGTHTYMAISEIGGALNLKKKGVVLLLENGFRINKPKAELHVEVSNSGTGYIYSAFFELTNDDIKLMSVNAITDYRLYIYDRNVTTGYTLREYLKSIVKK
jgi:hypothetical protein